MAPACRNSDGARLHLLIGSISIYRLIVIVQFGLLTYSESSFMRRTSTRPRTCGLPIRTQEYEEADLPILGEVLCAAELLLLHAAPSHYGLGIPRGDGSAVVLIPAFLCPDAYLVPLHQ